MGRHLATETRPPAVAAAVHHFHPPPRQAMWSQNGHTHAAVASSYPRPQDRPLCSIVVCYATLRTKSGLLPGRGSNQPLVPSFRKNTLHAPILVLLTSFNSRFVFDCMHMAWVWVTSPTGQTSVSKSKNNNKNSSRSSNITHARPFAHVNGRRFGASAA
jgi:hypothetical protein